MLALDDVSQAQQVVDSYLHPKDDVARDIAARSGDLFCNKCERRMRMHFLGFSGTLPTREQETTYARGPEINWRDVTELVQNANAAKAARRWLPCMLPVECTNCQTKYQIVLYQSPSGPSAVVLSATLTGATAHTPPAVSYYLDQAHRATTMGAMSAAVAMFRSALENLLFQQGFEGMLGRQLQKLDERIVAHTAPEWVRDIDVPSLAAMKELGNQAMHANSGDISAQDTLDGRLVRTMAAVMRQVLSAVYEKPAEREQHRRALQAAIKPKV
jgi:hypothetical protein